MEIRAVPELRCTDPLLKGIDLLYEAFLERDTREKRSLLSSSLRAVGITFGQNGKYRSGANYLERSADYACHIRTKTQGAFDRGLAALWRGDYESVTRGLDTSSRLYLNRGVSAWYQAVHAASLITIIARDLTDRPQQDMHDLQQSLREYALSRLQLADDHGYFGRRIHRAEFHSTRALDVLREETAFQELATSVECQSIAAGDPGR